MAAITTAELLWKYSVNTSPGNSTAQGNPNDSIGGYMSSTQWTGGTLHDLFDQITGDENAASESEYRCVFVHNTNSANALQNPKVWISAETAGGASWAIGLATQGVVTATQSGTPQASRVADENTAPSPAVTFSSPTTKTGGLSPANIPAGSVIGIWIRRTAANTAAVNNDGATIRIEGDTGAL
jgi:hypothetical protein